MAGRTSSGRLGSGDMARKNSGSWFKKTFGSKKNVDGSVTAVDVANSHSYQPAQSFSEIRSTSPEKSFATPKAQQLQAEPVDSSEESHTPTAIAAVPETRPSRTLDDFKPSATEAAVDPEQLVMRAEQASHQAFSRAEQAAKLRRDGDLFTAKHEEASEKLRQAEAIREAAVTRERELSALHTQLELRSKQVSDANRYASLAEEEAKDRQTEAEAHIQTAQKLQLTSQELEILVQDKRTRVSSQEGNANSKFTDARKEEGKLSVKHAEVRQAEKELADAHAHHQIKLRELADAQMIVEQRTRVIVELREGYSNLENAMSTKLEEAQSRKRVAEVAKNEIKEITQKIVVAKEEARIAAELADKKAARAQVETERAQLKRADVADAARALDETRTLVTLKERERHEATEAATAISNKIAELEKEVANLGRMGAERYVAADKANAEYSRLQADAEHARRSQQRLYESANSPATPPRPAISNQEFTSKTVISQGPMITAPMANGYQQGGRVVKQTVHTSTGPMGGEPPLENGAGNGEWGGAVRSGEAMRTAEQRLQ
ncbi:hypothetical protein WJX74_000577 [Apatococcus lobatus]|uniref:Paramyosin n=1 Tax=Apatococcus lobatus TaxID=904363 RepID=A0AAW1QWP4_9CHLO